MVIQNRRSLCVKKVSKIPLAPPPPPRISFEALRNPQIRYPLIYRIITLLEIASEALPFHANGPSGNRSCLSFAVVAASLDPRSRFMCESFIIRSWNALAISSTTGFKCSAQRAAPLHRSPTFTSKAEQFRMVIERMNLAY
jgi:hypothetical protein